MSGSGSTSTNGNASVPPTENEFSFSLLNSEKALQEIIQQPLLHGTDDHLIEFSEGLRNVAKALRRVTEGKASAEAESAEWKRKYELERARNMLLEQKVLSPVADCSELNVEKGRNLEEQTMSSDENRKQCDLCCEKDGICAHQVLRNGGPDINSSAAKDKMMRKASFKLSWYCKGEQGDGHKHDIVSFEKGNITTVERSSKLISLKWESPPRTVLIITKPNSTLVRNLCLKMVRWLKEHKNLSIFVAPQVKAELLTESFGYSFVQTWLDGPGKKGGGKSNEDMQLLHTKIDLLVTLGGDGTVLWAASMFKGPVPPIVPFSLGSLGFMTTFHSEHYREDLTSILLGPISITLRHRLQCHIIRSAANSEHENEGPVLVLNEVTIDRGTSSFLTNLECFCDDSFVTRVQGDGLILSTTSGSTAYSLAAGGSMVHPQVPGILFTPICPHSLSFRPLILPEHVTIRVLVPLSSRSNGWVSFDGKGRDGKDREQLRPGDALVCSMSPWPVPTACQADPTTDFLRSINDGLHWNMRKTQSSDGPRDT